jgi:hypothetical protein
MLCLVVSCSLVNIPLAKKLRVIAYLLFKSQFNLCALCNMGEGVDRGGVPRGRIQNRPLLQTLKVLSSLLPLSLFCAQLDARFGACDLNCCANSVPSL